MAWRKGRNGVTTFDLYTRRAPFGGAYLLVAGLEAALAFVRAFRYSERDLRYLSQVRDYDPAFLELLGRVRFTGDILAMPEGSIAFPDEPLLRVSAPFVEALLVEFGLLQAVNLATLLATKAARITTAAAGRRVAEFAFRRAQAPFTVSRSAYIGAAPPPLRRRAGALPATGHGYHPPRPVQLFDSEREAFEAVAESYNRYTVLLDTYDVRGAFHRDRGRPGGPGAPGAHPGRGAPGQRRPGGGQPPGTGGADRAGLRETRVLASGDMDEWSIAALVASGAPSTASGWGRRWASAGAPWSTRRRGAPGGVYKEVAYVDEDGAGAPPDQAGGGEEHLAGAQEVSATGALRGT